VLYQIYAYLNELGFWGIGKFIVEVALLVVLIRHAKDFIGFNHRPRR
jgi:hypothetical protein